MAGVASLPFNEVPDGVVLGIEVMTGRWPGFPKPKSYRVLPAPYLDRLSFVH